MEKYISLITEYTSSVLRHQRSTTVCFLSPVAVEHTIRRFARVIHQLSAFRPTRLTSPVVSLACMAHENAHLRLAMYSTPTGIDPQTLLHQTTILTFFKSRRDTRKKVTKGSPSLTFRLV